MALLSSAIGGVALWVAGAVFFDVVHWVLHWMLRSRSAILRGLAWPHSVHHQWLDGSLKDHPELQRRNIWCHLVPEYLTQLAFCAIAWLVLPGGMVGVCAVLQTVTFLGLLSYKGLDINHRPIEILDAYRPSWLPYPEYHALHHVYPDAYFSAYPKLVDWVIGGGAMLRGRRFLLQGGESVFGRALQQALRDHGVRDVGVATGELRECDVLVLCDPGEGEVDLVEEILAQTASRQLPPEVWVVYTGPPGAVARHYYRDVRVSYRVLRVDAETLRETRRAQAAARAVLFWVRRGFHYVPEHPSLRLLAEWRRFVRSQAVPPCDLPRPASRREWAALAQACS